MRFVDDAVRQQKAVNILEQFMLQKITWLTIHHKKKIKVTPATGAGSGISEDGLSPAAGIDVLISK